MFADPSDPSIAEVEQAEAESPRLRASTRALPLSNAEDIILCLGCVSLLLACQVDPDSTTDRWVSGDLKGDDASEISAHV